MSFLEDLRARLSGAKSTQQLLKEAAAQQSAGNWPEAAALWKQAIEKAPEHTLGQLNYAICLHRARRFRDAAGLAAWLTTRLDETHAPTAALIAILSFHAIGEYQHAAQLVAVLEKVVTHPVDLPGLPKYAFEGILEEWDSSPILNALRDLASKQLDPSLRMSVKALVKRYEERQRLMSEE